MESWALFTAEDGSELTRGYQASASQARRFAQSKANRLGVAVELVTESELSLDGADGDDYEYPVGEVFEPTT